MSILGTRVVRKEDPALLTRGGIYLADVSDPRLEGAAYVAYARSPMAHATISSIEVDEAKAAPGVLGVFTAADIDLAPVAGMMAPAPMARPVLAVDRVRFVGEPIAAVVAETAAQAADAVELIWADLEPLPAVVGVEEAMKDEVLLFPDHGSNVSADFNFGSADDLFDGCDAVVSLRIENQRVAACPLEGRAAAAAWAPDGRLHYWNATQHAHGARDAIAGMYGLEASQVRVVAPDVGGGFGAKISPTSEEALLPWLAREVGRPVRWGETRTENMRAMGHGRAQVQHVEMGGSRDGTIQAFRLNVLQDAGAYPAIGAVLPFMTRMMASGVYDIPKVECNAKSIVTTTASTVAYRGAGRPEATAAIERAAARFAVEIGMDPAEVRRKNLIGVDRFPFTTPMGTVYDIGDYEKSLDLVLEAAGYADLRAEQARRREAGEVHLLGIGLSIYVEVTAGTGGSEHARIEVKPDGRATVFTGTSPHGQGHGTAWSMLASAELGIPMDQIDVVHGDTDLIATGGGTSGSRSLQLGGSAVSVASKATVEEGREVAARLLEAGVEDVVLDTERGVFHVAGVPSVTKGWSEVASEVGDEGLVVARDFEAQGPTFPFGAHIAVVDVDSETGEVRLERLIAVDDAGRILNPLLVDGQRHGGLAQGAAQALYEQMVYDEDGNPTTSTFAEYAIVSAAELPTFELVAQETPTPLNPLGAKGIGESGTIGSTPAVQNAVIDALAHLGVVHVDMPCTPERVWRAIGDAAS
jgi:aerobic carbon-monoxide dehydrogenase large subunit